MMENKESNKEKTLERLMNTKTANLIKIVFISFTVLLSYIPLSSTAALGTNPTVTTGSSYFFDVESGQGGWQTDGLWHITTNRYHSPSQSFWYGDEKTKTYNTGGANSGSLISPEITLQSNSQPVLNFWSWYQTEYSKSHDTKLVQISVNNGPWTDLKKITDARKTWNKESINISNYAGNTIRLRFLFDTVDNNLNNYEGWYVDDIQITSYATSAVTTASTPTSTPVPTPSPTPAPVQISNSGQQYYVAKNGNDANPGTEAQPWLTITKAANTAVAGDAVYVKGGTYNEQVTVKNSGSPGKWITFASYPEYNVTIDGTGLSISNWIGLVHMNNKSYIKVSGFRIIHAPQAGIHVDNSDHVIIENNYIYDVFLSPIKVGWGHSSNITINGNKIDRPWRSDWGNTTFPGWQEVISISNTDAVEVRNNHVLQNAYGEGIDLKDGTTNGKVYNNSVQNTTAVGIYIAEWESYEHDIEVYQNIVHNSRSGFAVGSEKGGLIENVKFYNNIAYNNTEIGFMLSPYSEAGYTPQFKNIYFVNNIAYNNGAGGWGGGIFLQAINNVKVTNVIIRNNIASSNVLSQIGVEISSPNVAGIVVDHNLVYGSRDYYENDGTESSVGNPGFSNPASADFHLKSISPAIDRGSSTAAPGVDFDGNSRPKGAGYDIGAYEYVP